MFGMEFYKERKHTAHKEYTCEMCGKPINIGKEYWEETGKFEGDFFARRLHPRCHNFETKYCCDIDPEFCWDGVQDHIQDDCCFDGNCSYMINNKCIYDIYNCPFLTSEYGDPVEN